MNRMTWERLLSARRNEGAADDSTAGRPFYERDFDRILFSAPFRRLANKTQVHPLYQNDNLHHRLIHSVEVSSVAHSLGYGVGLKLVEENLADLPPEQIAQMGGVTRAAALAHDIGNPPFGHSGEAAIAEWFRNAFARGDAGPEAAFWRAVPQGDRAALEDFEGNAQGYRILVRNELYHPELYLAHDIAPGAGMELSAAVLGAFTKYPATAMVHLAAKAQGLSYCGLKKYGLYEALVPGYEVIARELGLIAQSFTGSEGQPYSYWCRHPLVFLVEAADDICYNIMDLEDAYAAGDLRFEQVAELLEPVAGVSNSTPATLVEHKERFIAHLRARAIHAATQACIAAFVAQYDAIMEGRFSGDLIAATPFDKNFADMKRVSREEVFTTRRKTELELYGRNLLHEILDEMSAALMAYHQAGYDMKALTEQEPYWGRLLGAVGVDLLGVRDPVTALFALGDFVSGMTDRYAVHFIKMIKGGL